jgi:D-lyxose ketol-isomerase
MKRSEVDLILNKNIRWLNRLGYRLPPQAYWDLDAWYANRDSAEEMMKRGIGWDLTDWGSRDFPKIGLLLFTLSNGMVDPVSKNPVDQPYAQKLLIASRGQVTPTHHHWSKMEDIIVLAGKSLKVKLNNVKPIHDKLDDSSDVRIMRNNAWETYAAGTVITLQPGERIRVEQHHYHKFWGHLGTTLVEEVSKINDDATDNCFLPQDHVSRFPALQEDRKPQHLLCTELPGTAKFKQLVAKYLK